MKLHEHVGVLICVAVLTGPRIEATKPMRPLNFDEIQGEWIGQCAVGEVFRLNLESPTSGSVRYLKPQWDEGVRAYPIGSIQFDGVTIKIVVTDREFGDFVLLGWARREFMDLKIKGLYGKEVEIRFVRPDAWIRSLERLRNETQP